MLGVVIDWLVELELDTPAETFVVVDKLCEVDSEVEID